MTFKYKGDPDRRIVFQASDSNGGSNDSDYKTGQTHNPKSVNGNRSTGYDPEEEGDTLVEKVMSLSRAMPSKHSLYLGRVMLMNDFSEALVSYAIEKLDSLPAKGTIRGRATSLLGNWVKNNRNDERAPIAIIHYDQFRSQLTKLFGGIENIVENKIMLNIANKLVRAQSQAAVPELEEDICSIAGFSYVLPRLPYEVQQIYEGIVDKAIEWNRNVAPGSRLRYKNLANILGNFEAFTRPHSEDAYQLIRKIKQKDRKNILFDLYKYIGEMPSKTPRNVIDFIDKVLEFLPDDGLMDDEEVKSVQDFVKTISESFEYHESFEIECFFDLCTHMAGPKYKCFKSVFKDIASFLEGSARMRVRMEEIKDDEYIPEDKAKLEERIDQIGIEYLNLSAETIRTHSHAVAKDFAEYVQAFNKLGLGPHQVLEDMELYKRGIIDGLQLSEAEKKQLANALRLERKYDTNERKSRRSYDSFIKNGPVKCPDYLRQHLLEEFGVEVDEIWDCRKFQMRLYFDKEAADDYRKLRARSRDLDFVKKILTKDIHKRGIIENHLTIVGVGCADSEVEIAFYEGLRDLGYDVHLDLNETSPPLLNDTVINCAKKGLKAGLLDIPLEKLSFDDLTIDRQVLVAFFGGHFQNLVERYVTAKRFHNILTRRDARTPRGEYIYQRFFTAAGSERMKDIIMIEGDLEKNVDYYRSHLSQRFLARGLRGLNGDYGIVPDMLTREGKLCHTNFLYDSEKHDGGELFPGDDKSRKVELHCVYLITETRGPFKEGQAVLVIDSGTMDKREFRHQMGQVDFRCDFIDGTSKNTFALCTTNLGGKDDSRKK
ncbi:hypothetical protein KY349_02435 [Candidatus Woesearchaeota archaeon]|nr:hypothetical protein [Candidatus Woesearchaeota archaeon]